MPPDQDGVSYPLKDLDAKFPIDRRLLKINNLEFSETQIAEIAHRANCRIMRRICEQYPIIPRERR